MAASAWVGEAGAAAEMSAVVGRAVWGIDDGFGGGEGEVGVERESSSGLCDGLCVVCG